MRSNKLKIILIDPYKIVLKRKIFRGFEQLSQDHYEPLIKLFSNNIHYCSAGNQALSVKDLQRRQWIYGFKDY